VYYTVRRVCLTSVNLFCVQASSASSSAPSLLDLHSQKQDEEHKAAAAKGSSLVDKHIMWDREKEMSMRYAAHRVQTDDVLCA